MLEKIIKWCDKKEVQYEVCKMQNGKTGIFVTPYRKGCDLVKYIERYMKTPFTWEERAHYTWMLIIPQ